MFLRHAGGNLTEAYAGGALALHRNGRDRVCFLRPRALIGRRPGTGPTRSS
ncbi:hypothetical protein AFE_2616 [Acidithiobacillus ferrooxidans ATCC 23270]|uniref:Uncharacterized protein n=1 Tax=Acidithiobacillus ferrooxidans (strain ATCC 23270 / DSM 14882 / CIP 104768 / NCIMB 8455) TaxID=243159 RepID=B7J7T1_ACIF2|nr:hypothetical protein AFE_2616 [Acidithiobacillus ferrooxidans ATCC 23270]